MAPAVLRQHSDRFAIAAILNVIEHVHSPVLSDAHQRIGAKLDQPAAEHAVATALENAVGRILRHVGELRTEDGAEFAGCAGRLRRAGSQRMPTAEQQILRGRQRRELAPGIRRTCRRS